MKKGLGIVVLLTVVGIILGIVSSVKIGQTGEEVEIKETVLYGDRAAAEGIWLNCRVTAGYRLFWDTEYVVGDDGTKTEFSFYSQVTGAERWNPEGAYINFNGYGGSYSDGGIELEWEQMAPMLEDVASRTEAGSTHTEEVSLGDYFSYYPLNVYLNVDNYTESVLESLRSEDESEANFTMRKADFFRVPVTDSEIIEVKIVKNEAGQVIGFELIPLSGSSFYSSYSALTEDSCYFAFVGYRTEEDSQRMIDMGERYGIYRIGFNRREEGTLPAFEAEMPELVFPLDPGVEVINLLIDDSRNELLLFTREDGAFVMTVIRPESMEVLQRAELPDWEGDMQVVRALQGDGYAALIMWNNKMVLMEVSDTGIWEEKMTVSLGLEELGDAYYIRLNGASVAADYNGERLALVFPISYLSPYESGTPNSRWNNQCRFGLAVYDETGMVFCGEYINSLGIEELGSNSYSCRLRNDTPALSVSWEG